MKTIEFKLYLKPAQEETLSSWMRTCCGIFNRALDQRIKAYKRRAESVNPSGTSQACPDCGAVKKKLLSEREHICSCGTRCHRDLASARVILARGLMSLGSNRPLMDPTADLPLVAVN